MALGGGTWSTQNKILPGYYVNFSSAARASSALSERGTVAIPLVLDWGPTDTVISITSADFQKDSMKLLGYPFDAPEMLPLREIFKNANTVLAYRLANAPAAAENTYATAKYAGTRGNDIKISIAENIDNPDTYDVSTYVESSLVDTQNVSTAADLVENDYVIFKSSASLAAQTGVPLTGGTNGSGVTGEQYQTFLDKIESYSFHALGCPSSESNIIGLFVAFTKRMRDEVGAKFKTIVFQTAADYEGVINVDNEATGGDASKYGLVYWVTGAEAGCEVNASNTNKAYDGEYTIDVDYTQAELEAGIKAGKYMLHNVNGSIRVLDDINSLTTLTDEKGADFQSNQTIRVCDQIANDVANLFATRYLGTVPNDASGRISLWNDICKIYEALETRRAIENFDSESVQVEQGETRKSVVCNVSGLNIINAMSQLYMSVVIA